MNDTISISKSQLDRLENEMQGMKTMLRRIMDFLEVAKTDDIVQARKELVATMNAMAKEANLSEDEAARLAAEAVQAVRAEKRKGQHLPQP